MKRRFSILLVCFENVPADFFFSSDTECISDCISRYLSLSLTLFLSLSISKAFLPISRSPFFSVLSLSVSLFNSSGSQSRADIMLGEQNRTRCQWNWASALLVLSFSFSLLFASRLSLSNQMVHLPFRLFLEGFLTVRDFICTLLSSPLLSSPLLSSPEDPLQCWGVIYHSPGH